jgi:hypothetical protein
MCIRRVDRTCSEQGGLKTQQFGEKVKKWKGKKVERLLDSRIFRFSDIRMNRTRNQEPGTRILKRGKGGKVVGFSDIQIFRYSDE